MSRLGAIDQVFIAMERAGMSPMVMGGAMILDPAGSPYPIDGKQLADHVAARMERIPLMRQKIVQDRLRIGSYRLVEDPDFDVRNHISRVTLAAPGGYSELTDCLGALSSQRLDMTRPLWHYEVIEGLEGGRLALATHIHHSIIDGIGALEALSSLWDRQPVPPERPQGRAWQVDEVPTAFELLRDALRENAERLYVQAPRLALQAGSPLLKSLWRSLPKAIGRSKVEREVQARIALPEVRKTSLNVVRVSAARAVSYVEFPLGEVKELSRRLECSINDLTLLLASCAAQRYFDGTGERVDFDLVMLMPVSVRRPGDTSGGNVLTAARLPVHNRIPELRERLRAIAADTTRIKRSTKPEHATEPGVDGRAVLGMFSPLLLEVLLYSAVRLKLLDRLALHNLGVTNVPGAPIPMYLAGAKQVGMVPMAPVIDGLAVTICVSSSDTLLAIGFHCCGETVKDKELFVEGARSGFEELKIAAGLTTASTGAIGKTAEPRSTKNVRRRDGEKGLATTEPRKPSARTRATAQEATRGEPVSTSRRGTKKVPPRKRGDKSVRSP